VDWANRAACLGVEPEVFFPVGSGGLAVRDVEAAKAICSHCPVIYDCRDYADRSRQPFGVWGGLDEDERRLSWSGKAVPATV
jgi:WhiB family transcriptional regulator, redox-sensing transcriptional regulator